MNKKYDEAEISRYKKGLLSILLLHKGKGNEISSGEIADILGIKDGDTHSIVRRLIKSCVYENHIPLAANGYGYFVINNEEEFIEYSNNLTVRAEEILERKNSIQQFYEESLEEEEETIENT